MTLIAAFRTKEGVAICADSQETITHSDGHGGYVDFRQTVQKIAPINVGGYQLVIAGSGDGLLIDGFIVRVERRFHKETIAPSIERALTLIEEELARFYTNDIPSDASFSIFVAASCPSTKEYKVWVSQYHILKELGDVELIGWEHPLYKVAASRLHSKDMSLTQAVLAAVHVMVIGEESSNYIKGPFSLTIVRENGIWAEDSEYIDTLRGRLKEFEVFTNKILLACADTTIHSRALYKSLARFALTAKELHEVHINEAVEKSRRKGFMVDDPICKVPDGLMVEISPEGQLLRVRHDVNGIEEMIRRFKEGSENESQRGEDNEGTL